MSKINARWTLQQWTEHCLKEGLDPASGTMTFPANKNPVAVNVAQRRPQRKGMNKTESEFLRQLSVLHPNDVILFEAIKLRIADRCYYCPDFMMIDLHCRLTFVEVKGKHIWEDSMIKFKAAREMYPWAAFEMHQKRADGWRRIH